MTPCSDASLSKSARRKVRLRRVAVLKSKSHSADLVAFIFLGQEERSTAIRIELDQHNWKVFHINGAWKVEGPTLRISRMQLAAPSMSQQQCTFGLRCRVRVST